MNNEEKEYIKLTPFKMQVLQSFPFIDADFDALTNYELLCKVVDYLNKTIDNVDALHDEIEEYINKFNELKAYVDNYFDNLDVQAEINNKLDEMAESGELTNLIKDYVDPIYEAFEDEINEDIDNQNNEITSFKSLINRQVQHIDEKVTNATSGSPKGVYATLQDLINANPDHDYTYVVTADGNWYYYDSTLGSWTSGGIYQSTGISESDPVIVELNKDISAGVLKDIKKYTVSEGEGKTPLTTNGYINPENGEIASTSAFKVSDLLNCSIYDTIYVSTTGYKTVDYIAFYDKYKNFISGEHYEGEGSNGSVRKYITVPLNTEYARVCIVSTDSASYIDYIHRENNLYDKLNEMLFKENNYNHALLITNTNFEGFINTEGVETSTSAFGTTDFIKVTKNDKISYKLKNNNNIAGISFYDGNHQFLSSIHTDTSSLSDLIGSVETVPENVMYCRVSYLVENNTQYFIVYNEIYENLLYIQNYLLEKSYKDNLFGKIMTATGDSINTTTTNRPYAGFGKMIAKKYNMKYTSRAIWGGTLASNISGSSGAIVSTIANMNSDADYILLSGGTNDFTYVSLGTEEIGTITTGYTGPFNTDTLCGALESICYQAINKWPGKKILYVITHRSLNYGTTYIDIMNNCCNKMIEILEKWGIPYVDLYHGMPSLFLPALKDLYTTNGNTEYSGVGDGLHPNEDGYKLYYLPPIESKLKEL